MDSKAWNQYSELVLSQLKDLQEGIGKLDQRLQGVELDLARMEARDQRIAHLETWRDRFDVDTKKDLDDLKQFKAKATFIFSVIQGAILITVFILRFLPKK